VVRARVLRESPLDIDVLRTLFLFEALSAEHLRSLVRQAVLQDLDTGLIVAEGEPARFFYVLVAGELSLSKRAGDRDVETTRTSHRGAYCGATAGYIDNPPDTYGFSVRATKPTQLVRIDGDYFGKFVRDQFPLAVHLLQGMHVDHEGVHQVIDQQRRIEAAGTLTAALMHGLNNPAGAIARIASQLRARHQADRQFQVYGQLTPAAATVYERFRLGGAAAAAAARTAAPSALEQVEQEERIDEWLGRHGVERSWELAPILAAGGMSEGWLQEVGDALEQAAARNDFAPVLTALTERMETLMLLDELAEATAEVSALVASAQRYSHLDSARLTTCHINELLDSTVAVMTGTFSDNIKVERHYDEDLPPMLCFAGELNQAWTNIIDNAANAIRASDAGVGTIALRTSQLDSAVIRVEISDTGVGIDPSIRDRIFLPFFTTKSVGEGIGMGLDLAWRTIVGMHRGSLSVRSRPGATTFTACLPSHGNQAAR
jgi:signal transduction histidine kinase